MVVVERLACGGRFKVGRLDRLQELLRRDSTRLFLIRKGERSLEISAIQLRSDIFPAPGPFPSLSTPPPVPCKAQRQVLSRHGLKFGKKSRTPT